MVILTVPDKAPFSTCTDAAHPAHRSAAPVFHPCLPACSPNTRQVIEEMDLCWAGVSLLVKRETGAQGKSLWRSEEFFRFFYVFHNVTKRILPNSPFPYRAVILHKDEDCSSAVCCRVVCLERHSCPEDLRFQRSELWWIEGEQQEGHGDSTEGTFPSVNTSRATSTWYHTADGSYLLLLLPPRFSLGATCVWFRRSETLKEKQYKLWWRIWTGESFHGFQF